VRHLADPDQLLLHIHLFLFFIYIARPITFLHSQLRKELGRGG
jgi:hypothetical protein